MAQVIEVGLKVTGADKAASQVDKVDDATKGLNDNLSSASGALDQMTGGAASAFTGIISGAKKATLGMKTFRGAVISTGIGALVVAVGSLVAYFTQTERGAQKLEVAMAGIRVIFGKLTDLASSLGEKLFSVFNDPKAAVEGLWSTIKQYFIDKFHAVVESVGLLGSAFKKLFSRDFSGAFEDAKKGATGLFMELTPMGMAIETAMYIAEEAGPVFSELGNEIMNAVDAATALQKRSIKLREDQRKLAVAFAEGRAQIKEYNLIAEDTTRTLEERLEAGEKAIQIEKDLMAERQRIAEEELAIHKANMALTESTEEDKQKLVDLEVALINIRTESAEMQTTLNNKINTIRAQADAEEERRTQEALAKKKAAMEEEAAAAKKLADRIYAEAQRKIAAEEAAAQATRKARQDVAAAAFDVLKSMAKTEEGQKKLAIAQILMNQGIAMAEAIRSAQQSAAGTGPGAVFTAPGFTASMIALVLGTFAQVKGIMNQAGAATGGVGDGGSGGGGGGGGVGSFQTQLGLTPDLDQINQAATPGPVQAYVVQTQLNDEAALTEQIESRAAL